MANTNAENLSMRKKIYKKAAVLAAVATITGVASTSTQKAEKSEAIFGLILGVVSTVMGVGTEIAGSVQASKQNAEQERLQREEEERIRKEEEAAREAERVAAALKDAKNDVRLQQQQQEELDKQQQEGTVNKVINMQIADNSNVANQAAQQSVSVFKTGSLNRPANPPKDVHIGGFGADIEEEDVVEENNNAVLQNNVEQPQESNIVRFSLNDLDDDDLDELISQTNSEEFFAELDVSSIMSEKEAMNHELVQLGYLSAEELILLDFGIRNGTIDQNILDEMLEQGIVTDEYYEGACYLIAGISEEDNKVDTGAKGANKVHYEKQQSVQKQQTVKQETVKQEVNHEEEAVNEEVNYEEEEAVYEEVNYEEEAVNEEVDYEEEAVNEEVDYEEEAINEDEIQEGFGTL